MFSPLTIPTNSDSNEESMKINVYDEQGYLPIHRAALQGHEAVLRTILDEAQKRNELNQQLEALTHDGNEMTPLLLATAAGRLETIACLISYPVNFQAVDTNGHDFAAIAVLSQNERTLRYIIDLQIDYNVWKSIFKLFLSIKEDESSITGRMLETLTRQTQTGAAASISYWHVMLENGFLPTLVQLFHLSKQDDVLLSAFLLLFHLLNELPETKFQLKSVKNVFSSMLKHTQSENEEILTLLGRVLALISEEKSLVNSMVEQGLLMSVMQFLHQRHSPSIISSYFDCLSNVIAYDRDYQQNLSQSRDFLILIVNVYLEELDLSLSLAVIRFIRQLVKHNQQIQNILAHYGACEHLLGALAASSKELQYVTIEAIQAIAEKNSHVQEIFLRERAIEQLLNLFEKTNLSHVQVVLVCTLWTLCENNLSRRRDVAMRIGVKKLISFYTLKADEHLLAVTEAINELAKCAASAKMNVPDEIHRAQGIPYLIRLLKSDDEALVLSVLRTLQLISAAPGFIANRVNQDSISKNDGLALIVALMMHAKSEIVQVEAAQTLACIALGHPTCSLMIENTLDFSYSHLMDLMQSSQSHVQLKSSNALATFVYNNARVQLNLMKQCHLSFDYFDRFLRTNEDERRCAAAFQIVVLANLIEEQRPPVNTAIGCGILMDILRKSHSEEAKSAAAESLARLAHMKSVSEINKYTGVPQALIAVNAIDYLCNLFASSNETTIGNASIALGFLSHVPEGRRRLLNRCRSDANLMSFLQLYNCLPDMPARLSKHLLDDWNRYNNLQLPQLRSNKRYTHPHPHPQRSTMKLTLPPLAEKS